MYTAKNAKNLIRQKRILFFEEQHGAKIFFKFKWGEKNFNFCGWIDFESPWCPVERFSLFSEHFKGDLVYKFP